MKTQSKEKRWKVFFKIFISFGFLKWKREKKTVHFVHGQNQTLDLFLGVERVCFRDRSAHMKPLIFNYVAFDDNDRCDTSTKNAEFNVIEQFIGYEMDGINNGLITTQIGLIACIRIYIYMFTKIKRRSSRERKINTGNKIRKKVKINNDHTDDYY